MGKAEGSVRKACSLLLFAAFAVWITPSSAFAAPVYVDGSVCPNPQGDFTRQYSVIGASECVYDPDVKNITGTNQEADAYLNTDAAHDAGWVNGGTWTGLGQTEQGQAGDTDGTFTIDTSIFQYSYFGIALKDGGEPKWAIFQVQSCGENQVCEYDWEFLSGGGSLSHFALFGKDFLGETDEPQTIEPEPASLLLLGTGLAVVAARVRSRSKSRG
jgi:hypothetical protein